MILPNAEQDDLRAILVRLAEKANVAPFSFGIAHTGFQGREPKVLYDFADGRIYEMKQEHKGLLEQVPVVPNE